MLLRTQITNDIRNGAESSGGSGGGGGDAVPQGIHVWIERFTKLKPLAFRSAATACRGRILDYVYESYFKFWDVPTNFKTSFPCWLKTRRGTGPSREQGSLLLGSALVYGSSTEVNDTRTTDFRGHDQRVMLQGSASRGCLKTLLLHLFVLTCEKPHLGVCYKGDRDVLPCGSTQHKVVGLSRAKQKQIMPTDFARTTLHYRQFMLRHVIRRQDFSASSGLRAIASLVILYCRRIILDPTKVEAITNGRDLPGVTRGEKCSRLAGYYRHFVDGFLPLALPLNPADEKGESL
ncbi:hypothetical protein Tco_0810181 [Tanacetum coccineum]